VAAARKKRAGATDGGAKPARGGRRKKAEPASRGLDPAAVAESSPPAEVRSLAQQVRADGGAVLGTYRGPLGDAWQLLVALPLNLVAPTPFQRDLSPTHVERLARVIDTLDRFLDPVIVVRNDDGTYWTPNGYHRSEAMRRLGARTIVALLVPERMLAYQILALNTEKAHNVREKSLEAIRMARSLRDLDDRPESEYGELFEEPSFLTLGLCYERNGRFAGGAYHPVLKRVESFSSTPLSEALATRETRAKTLLEIDEAVGAAVDALQERGFQSPYLKAFVIARVNPVRFRKAGTAGDPDDVLARMLEAARSFDPSSVRADQVARTAGAPAE
jgi:ParB family chromosome partitioning protein